MIQPLNPVANLQAIRRPEGQAEWPGGDAVSQKYPEFPTDKLQEIKKKKEEGGRDISRLNDAWKHGTPFNKWGRLNDNALGMQTGRAIYSEMRARGGRDPHAGGLLRGDGGAALVPRGAVPDLGGRLPYNRSLSCTSLSCVFLCRCFV